MGKLHPRPSLQTLQYLRLKPLKFAVVFVHAPTCTIMKVKLVKKKKKKKKKKIAEHVSAFPYIV